MTGFPLRAALVLGVGFGAFFDGIVFHQLLQWHHLYCFSCRVGATADDVRRNVFFDGLFHVVALMVSTIGVAMLWRDLHRRRVHLGGRELVGGALMGWGAFNVIEGLIDHEILGLHHVHPGTDQVAWDFGFLVFGAALVVAGKLLSAPRRHVVLKAS